MAANEETQTAATADVHAFGALHRINYTAFLALSVVPVGLIIKVTGYPCLDANGDPILDTNGDEVFFDAIVTGAGTDCDREHSVYPSRAFYEFCFADQIQANVDSTIAALDITTITDNITALQTTQADQATLLQTKCDEIDALQLAVTTLETDLAATNAALAALDARVVILEP